MTTITIYCPACRQWTEENALPKVGDKVVHGCGYESAVSGELRAWIQADRLLLADDES